MQPRAGGSERKLLQQDFFLLFSPPSETMQVDGTGYTGQRHNCSFLMVGATALTTVHNVDCVLFCLSSSAGLQEMLLLLRRIEESNKIRYGN